jgi:hypothetical protein
MDFSRHSGFVWNNNSISCSASSQRLRHDRRIAIGSSVSTRSPRNLRQSASGHYLAAGDMRTLARLDEQRVAPRGPIGRNQPIVRDAVQAARDEVADIIAGNGLRHSRILQRRLGIEQCEVSLDAGGNLVGGFSTLPPPAARLATSLVFGRAFLNCPLPDFQLRVARILSQREPLTYKSRTIPDEENRATWRLARGPDQQRQGWGSEQTAEILSACSAAKRSLSLLGNPRSRARADGFARPKGGLWPFGAHSKKF